MGGSRRTEEIPICYRHCSPLQPTPPDVGSSFKKKKKKKSSGIGFHSNLNPELEISGRPTGFSSAVYDRLLLCVFRILGSVLGLLKIFQTLPRRSCKGKQITLIEWPPNLDAQ
jgi:hypothetical protein